MKVISVKPVGIKSVKNLHVFKNHTFITKNGIVTHNCDGANHTTQKACRGFLEEFHNNCRVIATCNYVNKIIPALRSRFQEFDFNMNSQEYRQEMIPKVIGRVCGVLKAERIEYDPEAITSLVDEKFPDIRKVYNVVQQYAKMYGLIDKNVLNFVAVDDQLYKLILQQKFTAARQFVLDSGYNFEDVYVDLYRNFVPLIPDKVKQCQAIILIADYQHKSTNSLDKEIPFAALLSELVFLSCPS
jgi:DNA polymerase III delta prime subunit